MSIQIHKQLFFFLPHKKSGGLKTELLFICVIMLGEVYEEEQV